MVEHDAESQQQPISALGDEVCAADPSPKLSSPDAHMQAFGRKRRDYPRMISRADLLRPICTFPPIQVSTLHCPQPSIQPVHRNSTLSHEPRDHNSCDRNLSLECLFILILDSRKNIWSYSYQSSISVSVIFGI